jgi:hypothetical protein
MFCETIAVGCCEGVIQVSEDEGLLSLTESFWHFRCPFALSSSGVLLRFRPGSFCAFLVRGPFALSSRVFFCAFVPTMSPLAPAWLLPCLSVVSILLDLWRFGLSGFLHGARGRLPPHGSCGCPVDGRVDDQSSVLLPLVSSITWLVSLCMFLGIWLMPSSGGTRVNDNVRAG